MTKFQTISEILSYVTKPDKTNTDPRYLISGSQNVLIDETRKVKTRNGYELLGASSTATTPTESSFTWKTSSGDEWPLRGYDDELEVYLGTVDSIALNAWTKLKDGWSSVAFKFATWWNTTTGFDLLKFVAQDDNIYSWTGAVTTIASATANTITKNGTATWAAERFTTTGSVIINGTEYAYTGGTGTTTLTGVTPNPSSEAANSAAMQAVTTHSDEPATGLTNDLIEVLNNQLYVGDLSKNEIYVSKNTDPVDFTYSSPRIPGEGALLTLDNPAVGFVSQEDRMYITAGQHDWYQTEFNALEVSNTLTETLNVKKLKTAPLQAAQSQDLITKVNNAVCFLGNDDKLYLMERVENIEYPFIKPISDDVKPDFEDETWTNGHLIAYRNWILLCSPTNDKVYINETREEAGELVRFWQPPQILPIRQFSVINGLLYGHSSGAPETYKLFTGEDDNGNPFKAVARFAYRSFDERDKYKVFDEYFTEGYIAGNTTLKLKLYYDYEGHEQILEYDIDGSDSDILAETATAGSLGDSGLGDTPLGGESGSESIPLNKFRIIHEIPPYDFFEICTEYWTDEQDYNWSILAHGPNARLSPNKPTFHKR